MTGGLYVSSTLTGRCFPEGVVQMERQKYCVYNQTRECFLSLGVLETDIPLLRLKTLISSSMINLDEGLWVVPPRGIRSLGGLFPFDLVYLDRQYQVVAAVEALSAVRQPAGKVRAVSVLVLPAHSIYSSQTLAGDRLLIGVVEEMEQRLAACG
jgi:hypothetical protein